MKAKKILAGILAASTAVSLAACNSNNATSSTSGSTSSSSKTEDNSSATSGEESSTTPSGEKITLKVLTHRTDRKDDGSLDKMTTLLKKSTTALLNISHSRATQMTFRQ